MALRLANTTELFDNGFGDPGFAWTPLMAKVGELDDILDRINPCSLVFNFWVLRRCENKTKKTSSRIRRILTNFKSWSNVFL
jgi:hypothetical protein